MGTIATLAVKVIGDTKDFDQKMDGAKSKADKIGKGMQKVGGVMTAGLTLPIVAVGVAAMNMASDVEESMSKVQTLFGTSADEVIAWSETTADGYGIAKADALAFTGELGNVLIAQGLANDSAAELSVDMVELAADMASFNNASPEETFAAIQAGAIGSTEPLRKYGVVLTAASVEQTALEMTGKKTSAELTEQDKTLARLKLITEQTSAAHGDFAKTSDGLANSTKIAQANFKDIGAELGQQLLPIGIKLIGWVQQAINWFKNLTEGNKKLIVIVLAVVAAIGPLIGIIGSLIGIFTTLAPVITVVAGLLTFPLIAIIAAVIAIVALVALAWKNNWGDIQGKTKAVVAFLKGYISDLVAGIKEKFELAKEIVLDLKDKFVTAFEGIKNAIKWVIDKATRLLEILGLIKIPKQLTGESPSPFEVSLRGIADAMGELNTKQMPEFANNMVAMDRNSVTYELNYQGVQSTELDITGQLELLGVMRR